MTKPLTIADGLRMAWESTPCLREIIPTERVWIRNVAYNQGNVPYAVIIDGGSYSSQSDHDATIVSRSFRIHCYVNDRESIGRLAQALQNLARIRIDCEEGHVLASLPPLMRISGDHQGVQTVTVNLTLRVAVAAPHIRRIGV